MGVHLVVASHGVEVLVYAAREARKPVQEFVEIVPADFRNVVGMERHGVKDRPADLFVRRPQVNLLETAPADPLEYTGNFSDRVEACPQILSDPILVGNLPFGGHLEVLEDMCFFTAVEYGLDHPSAALHPFFVRLCEVVELFL